MNLNFRLLSTLERTMALESTELLTEISARHICCGLKVAGGYG